MAADDRYRLIYYHGRGRAESLRYLLVLAGQPFEDCRLSIAQWKALKKRESYSTQTKLPILQINDRETLFGSTDIGKRLAVNFELYGKDLTENREIDSIIEKVENLYPNLSPVLRATLAKNDKNRRAQWEIYKENTLGDFMETIGRRLEKGTFLVGNQLTWADVAVAEMLTRFEQCYDSNALRDWPKIKQFCLNIERHPQLKLWIENRPRSVF